MLSGAVQSGSEHPVDADVGRHPRRPYPRRLLWVRVGADEPQIEVFLVRSVEQVIDAADQAEVLVVMPIAPDVPDGKAPGALFDDGGAAAGASLASDPDGMPGPGGCVGYSGGVTGSAQATATAPWPDGPMPSRGVRTVTADSSAIAESPSAVTRASTTAG